MGTPKTTLTGAVKGGKTGSGGMTSVKNSAGIPKDTKKPN